MGINYSSQSSTNTQNINNKVLNASTANCSSTCQLYSGSNTVIINGTTIEGNVTFDQQCTLSMSCSINSTLNSNVQNLLTSIQNQNASTETGFPSFSITGISNVSQANQNITTSIANLINSQCQSTDDIVSQNNFTYLNNSTVEGSLTFSQTGSVNNNCTLNNTSSIVATNQALAQSSQTATITNPLGLIFVALIIVAIVIGAIFIVNFLFKKGSSGGGGGGGKPTPIPVEGGNTALLSEAAVAA